MTIVLPHNLATSRKEKKLETMLIERVSVDINRTRENNKNRQTSLVEGHYKIE
jgi:hypothetical protein